MEIEAWIFLGSVVVSIVGGIFGLWCRAHNRQARRIDELSRSNSEAHKNIHEKIDALDDKSAERHNVVRDKIEQIWQHLVGRE